MAIGFTLIIVLGLVSLVVIGRYSIVDTSDGEGEILTNDSQNL